MAQKSSFGRLWAEQKVNIIGWAVVILVIAAIAFFALGNKQQGQEQQAAVLNITAQDHVKGTGELVLIEYSDFQCPACAAYEEILKEVLEKRGDKIKFVYRHMPLVTIHPNAVAAGIAAEAANRQGKFWEMHTALFASQNEWSQRDVTNPNDLFKKYAKDIGLDEAKFAQDLSDSSLRDRVLADRNAGESIGINSTPTFYLNGNKLDVFDAQGFIDAIDAARGVSSSSSASTSSSSASATSTN